MKNGKGLDFFNCPKNKGLFTLDFQGKNTRYHSKAVNKTSSNAKHSMLQVGIVRQRAIRCLALAPMNLHTPLSLEAGISKAIHHAYWAAEIVPRSKA